MKKKLFISDSTQDREYKHASLEYQLIILENEIRRLLELIDEKNEEIRDMSIKYDRYMTDFWDRYGAAVSNYESMMRETYWAKKNYYDLLEQQENNDNDKISKLKEEIAALELKMKEEHIPLKAIEENIDKLDANTAKNTVQTFDWALKGTSWEKISPKVTEQIKKNLKDKEELLLSAALGENPLQSPLYTYLAPSLQKEKIQEALNTVRVQVMKGKNPRDKYIVIRAAIDAQVLSPLPVATFKKAFPTLNVSSTTYNKYVSTANSIPPTMKSQYSQMLQIFRIFTIHQ